MLETLLIRVSAFCANPITAIVALSFCTVWFALSFFSNGGSLTVDGSLVHHGKFDPGMTVGGYITNAIQLVLLFVAAYSADRAHRHARKAAQPKTRKPKV